MKKTKENAVKRTGMGNMRIKPEVKPQYEKPHIAGRGRQARHHGHPYRMDRLGV